MSCLRQVKYSLVVLKCTLTTPMSSLGWLQFRRQQLCSLSPTRDKSGHVRSLVTVQNQTRICTQSKLRSSQCLAKNKAERIVLMLCTLVERLLASKSTSESSSLSRLCLCLKTVQTASTWSCATADAKHLVAKVTHLVPCPF